MGYRSVVVGTDGSPTASIAVRHAVALAAASDARLVLVTAYTPDHAAEARAAEEIPEDLRWMITDAVAAEETVAEAKTIAREAGISKVRTRVASGDAARVLIEAAEDTGADLIVVGSKGMTGHARFILGSVPNSVSHHAPCDVLIVHTV